MSNVAPRLSLLDVSFYERPVKLRLPFRFGVVTLTEAPQMFVRARVKLDGGREGEGIAAELLYVAALAALALAIATAAALLR